MYHRLLPALLLLLLLPMPTAHAQGLSDEAFEATISAANQRVPGLGRPDRWEFEILLPSTDSAVMCRLVPGFKTDTTRQPFIVSLFYGETTYTLHAADDGSIIQPCDPQLGNIGMQPLPALPRAADACTVTPGNGEFANVRLVPEVEAEQTGTITGEQLVLGRNEDTTWYLVESGWVAGTVVSTAGDCSPNILPARDPNIVTYTLTVPAAGSTTNGTPIAAIPSDFTCPPNFEGYLTPRITTGQITAQVEQGGLPNTLRTLPTTESEQVGQIQPGRRIDRVWNGPQCSSGFVWWDVQVDGVRGWTAESSAADNTYFLAPTTGSAATPPPTPASEVAQLPAAAATAITLQNIPSVENTFTVDDRTVASFAWRDNPVRGEAYIVSADDENLLVDPVQNTTITYELIAEEVNVFAANNSGDVLAMGDTTGGITLLLLNTDASSVRLPDAHGSTIERALFNPDDTLLATTSTDGDEGILHLWNAPALRLFTTEAVTVTDPPLRNIRFPFPVADVAFSANGEHMAVVAAQRTDDPDAALWVYADGGTGENTLTLLLEDTQGAAFVEPVPADAGGDFIYGRGGDLYSLDVASGEERPRASQPAFLVTDVAFGASESGDVLMLAAHRPNATASTDDAPLLGYDYSVPGELNAPVTVAQGSASAVQFNTAGSTFAVLGTDGTLRFFALP